MEDLNGNQTLSQASVSINVEGYEMFALCDAFAIIDGERESVIFTETDDGFVECEIGFDNLLRPDTNFTVEFEGAVLSFLHTNFDEFFERDTHVYRAEVTDELDALARSLSTDGENWEGTGTVFITHPTYGSLDAIVQIAVTFEGTRLVKEEDEIIDFTEVSLTDFTNWWNETGEMLQISLLDPIGWIQGNFFVFLLSVFLIVIVAPLILYAMFLTAFKGKQENGG